MEWYYYNQYNDYSSLQIYALTSNVRAALISLVVDKVMLSVTTMNVCTSLFDFLTLKEKLTLQQFI